MADAHVVGLFPAQGNGAGLGQQAEVGNRDAGGSEGLDAAGHECEKQQHGDEIGKGGGVKQKRAGHWCSSPVSCFLSFLASSSKYCSNEAWFLLALPPMVTCPFCSRIQMRRCDMRKA